MTALSYEATEKLRPYSGPLYGSTLSYMVWPILPQGSPHRSRAFLRQEETYQLVLNGNGNVIDMIVRLENNQYAKCWRVDKQQSETSINSVMDSNGYECGPEFIPDSTITESARIARKYSVKDYIYPSQYRGNLYSEDVGYKIWPIYYKTLVLSHNSFNQKVGSIYIVLDSTGQLKDVIAKTFEKNHIRCRRARKVSPATDANELSQTLAKLTRDGYICQDEFFHYDYLTSIREKVQKEAETKLSLPRYYTGAPFHTPCYLVPFKEKRKSFKEKRKSHRVEPMDKKYLVLAIDFRIMGVAMQVGKDFKRCERDKIPIDNQHRNIFLYSSEDILPNNIASAAEIAQYGRINS
ncbi:hypothetical protein EPUL_006454, partial [Erysiphe pulchra]